MESFGVAMVLMAVTDLSLFVAGALWVLGYWFWLVPLVVAILAGQRMVTYARVATDPVIVSLIGKRDEKAAWEAKRG